ncbi:hypothetical protein [Halobaculum saliterrae]|uniref:hypothetical protein n=1 Tax=Halobaculum saliterrae TaxID=2073113 RepID=UPI001915A692|nr:hypothetical protein [Halobaculum saliterrae]
MSRDAGDGIGPKRLGSGDEPSEPSDPEADDGPTAPESTDAETVARVERLSAENRRLREQYARVRRTEYRRAALALAGLGAVAVGAAALFPAVREVLLVLGAIGLFGAVLTRYLTPERFVSADVGERVYAALADNEAAVTAELGLQDERVYVPVGPGDPPARLFVPQRREYEVPDGEALEATFVVPEEPEARGVAFDPTGGSLYREFTRTVPGEPAEAPTRLVEQLSESCVETFEIADAVETDVDAATGRATVKVTGGAFGAGDRFDDPVGSLIAVGLAVGLDAPVRVESASVDGGYTVTCRWYGDGADGDGNAGGEAEADSVEDGNE